MLVQQNEIMDILNSDWLISMLKKSSSTPHGRLLSLFEILEDWFHLTYVDHTNPAQLYTNQSNPDQLNTIKLNAAKQLQIKINAQTNSHQLQNYLSVEAAKAGAAMPEMLANQLYFMAIAAMQENLHANKFNSLAHAKSAAHALIIAQTKKEFYSSKLTVYGIAASLLGVLVVTGALYSNQNFHLIAKQTITSNHPTQTVMPQLVSANNTADSQQTAALIAQVELMRHGSCQLIEAIQLPDEYKGIYLNMVVNGQVSTNPREQKIAFALLKQTRCNYTPMLMANSK